MKKFISILLFTCLLPILSAQTFGELEKKAGEKMSNGHYDEALAYYEEAIVLITDSSSHSTIYAYAGICAQELGNTGAAKDYFLESVERGIEEPQIFDRLGELCRKEKDYDTQIAVYKTGAERSPADKTKYQLKLCLVYKKQKNAEELLNTSEAILLSDSQNTKALEYKGTALQYQKKMNDAKAVFTELYTLDNENINANIFLGNYYYQVGKNKLSSSRKKYDKIVKPTRMQWHEENEKNKVTMEKYYRPSIMHLEFVYSIKPQSSIKKMLYTMYTKLGEKESAALYSAE